MSCGLLRRGVNKN